MRRPSIATRAYWFQRVGKGVAVAASTGAALVSIISALFSYGVLGKSESHQSLGNLGAAWVRLKPAVDTASAIGDTIHFAATVADKNGSILVGARPTWTTGDATIATVGADGAVVARGPGSTTVTVVVGTLVETSRIVVRQKVAGVVVSSSAGDTAAAVLEGSPLQLRARALDARGHIVAQAGAAWHIDDSSVAVLDSAGVLVGRSAGRSVVSARIDGKSGYLPISVVMTAANLDLVAGSGQRALAGRALAQPVVVRATNRRGEAAPNKMVTFRAADGAGRVQPDTARTDADGRARATWTLADYPGRQSLVVTVENLDSALTVVAESEPVAANTRLVATVDSMRAPAGTSLPDSVSIRVTDSTGRALGDVPVVWTTLDGGEVDVVDARTDSTGLSRVRWTLAGKVGVQRLRAQVGSIASARIAPVVITARALPGGPADVVIVSGDRQSAAAGSALKKPIVVRVLDSLGNGVGNVPIVLSPSLGSVPDTIPRTDSTGSASIRWTMGRSATTHSLAVHVEGIRKLLKVSAVSTPASPANLSFEDAPAEKAPKTRAKRLYALVTDVYGNPVPDAPVTFASKSGSVTPARAVTDAKGRVLVRWLPGATAEEQTLVGQVRASDVKGSYVTQVARRAVTKD
ncbi:MAG TPA: Ig-like domain-containing protein [Gemmatimonadaceae bacterium]|nr:Ig-like domain-containing protein [Gemmatimonadaceae bacterium]